MTTPNDMFAALDPFKDDLVYEGMRCKMRFDGKEQVTRTCQYHTGRKEVDLHGSAIGAMEDYWTDRNPMNNLGPPETLIQLDQWQLGASWSCCNMRADFSGCEAREHDLWAKVHIIPEPTLLQEVDNDQGDEQAALGAEPIIGQCKTCRTKLTAQSLRQTHCYHHPEKLRQDPGAFNLFKNEIMPLMTRLVRDPKWRPYFLYKCCGRPMGEEACAVGAHELKEELRSDSAAAQGGVLGAGVPPS